MTTLRRTVSETSLWQREGAMTPLRRLYMQEHWNAGTKNMKINANRVDTHVQASVLLTNIYILYGSETAAMFRCRPPTLEEYLDR